MVEPELVEAPRDDEVDEIVDRLGSVIEAGSQEENRRARLTDLQRQASLRQLDEACGAPHFLGARFSAIDLYLAAMCSWRPGRKWWQANAPKLLAAATKAREKPEIAPIVAKEFA